VQFTSHETFTKAATRQIDKNPTSLNHGTLTTMKWFSHFSGRILTWRILTGLVLLTSMPVFGQVCIAELRADEGGAELQVPADGYDAVRYLARAVRLLEPVLPRFDVSDPLPIDETDSAYEDARYLLERRLLPASWQPDSIDLVTWQTMLTRLGRWYDLTPLATTNDIGDLTRRTMILTLAELIGSVQQQITPVALIASAENNPNQINFWAIIRNDGVYPRMIVVRPPSDITLQNGAANVLPALSSCATPLDNFIFAPANVARQLFLSTNQSSMIVASAAPENLQMEVPNGQEIAFLDFSAPELVQIDRYAALFPGPSLGVGTILGLIPRVRTNMSPGEIIAFLQL
jgi:hypothetical protein